jgi:hypothetical protein
VCSNTAPRQSRIKLTVKALDAPKAPKAGYAAYRYKETPGLEHRVYARRGHAPAQQTFYFGPYRVRGNSKSQRFPLGEWRIGDGETRLGDILARWRQAREDVRAGSDPKVKVVLEADAKQRAAEDAENDTVNRLLDNWLKREVEGKLRSAEKIKRHLDRLVRPRIGHLSKYALRRGAHIVPLLDRIADENGERTSDLILSYLQSALSFEERRNEEFRSPIIRGMRRLKSNERDRVLADDEIRDFCAALEVAQIPPRHRAYLTALLYTTRRRAELSEARWEEVEELDGELVHTVPGERSKSGEPITTPLIPTVAALFGPRQKSGFIFRPLTGMHKAKLELERIIAGIRNREGRSAMSPWTWHDLRRTGRTLLSRANVPTDIAERVLGHVIGGVRGVYDHHDYLEQKRDALEKLVALIINRILHPPGDNVASLEEVRAARP